MAEFAAPSGSARLGLWTRNRAEQPRTPHRPRLPEKERAARTRAAQTPAPTRRQRGSGRKRGAIAPPAWPGSEAWSNTTGVARANKQPATQQGRFASQGETNVRCSRRAEKALAKDAGETDVRSGSLPSKAERQGQR